MPDDYLITIDLSSQKPIYRQIADAVIEHIATGRLSPEERLPSSRRLSALLGINYHTVNKAYEILIQEGFVHLDRRKKIIVNLMRPDISMEPGEEWNQKMGLLLTEAISRGFSPALIMSKIQYILDSIEEKKESKR